MTEEIIIDGVNVAGCCYYNNGKCSNPNGMACNCINNAVCYFKELKRLEQENKELKEELKSYKHPDVVTLLTNWRTGELDRIHNKIANERDVYRSALEEILESAKFAQCLPCGSGNLEDCLNCADEITNNGQFCMEKRIHEIKTKCVEVLNESN